METHQPHHITHKKKWTEYLLEFFMLFLAVFLGFVAENIRENSVEKHREKEFAQQLVTGLKQDSASLSRLLVINKLQKQSFDSLLIFLAMDDGEPKWSGIYRHVFNIVGAPLFVPQRASFDQIKNTGSLRFFKNKDIVNRLTNYQYSLDLLRYQQEIFMQFSSDRLEPFILSHFDENLSDQRFESHIFERTNKQTLRPSFYNNDDEVRLFKNLILVGREDFLLSHESFQYSKPRIDELITLIEKEYHLKE